MDTSRTRCCRRLWAQGRRTVRPLVGPALTLEGCAGAGDRRAGVRWLLVAEACSTRAEVVTLLRTVEPGIALSAARDWSPLRSGPRGLVDYDAIVRTAQRHAVRAVFHLPRRQSSGRPTSPSRPSDQHPRHLHLLEPAAASAWCPVRSRIVVASSDKAYGRHEQLPYREDFHCRRSTPTTSEAATDMIARSYAAKTRCGRRDAPRERLRRRDPTTRA